MIKAQQAEELALLLGKNGSKRDLVARFSGGMDSSGNLEMLRAQKANELAMLQGNGSKTNIFTMNPEQSTIDRIKAQTSKELAMLQGQSGSRKNLLERFSPGQNLKVNKFKSQTASELAALTGGSLRSVTDELNRSLRSSAVDRFKSQTAAELAAVQAEQLRKKKAAEESAEVHVSGDDSTADESVVTTFTAEELAAFEEERKAKERELEELRHFSSEKVLASRKTQAAAELEELRRRRRERVSSQE
jgi:hypothetical protein